MILQVQKISDLAEHKHYSSPERFCLIGYINMKERGRFPILAEVVYY